MHVITTSIQQINLNFEGLLLTYLISTEFVTFINTTPKLGHILFDPLKYEALKFIKKNDQPDTSKNVLRRFLRTEDKPDDKTKPCKGYDYDDTICKFVGERAICGYNKNMGELKDATAIMDIGDGCFIRGDRIECGYVLGPFKNPRRPPSDSQIKAEDSQKLRDSFIKRTVSPSIESTTTKCDRSIERQTNQTDATTTERSVVTEATKTEVTTVRSTVTVATKTETPTTEMSTVTETKTGTCGIESSTQNQHNADTNKHIKERIEDHTIGTTIKSTSNILTTKIYSIVTTITSNSVPRITTTEQSTSSDKYKRKCVEKKDSIFCYE